MKSNYVLVSNDYLQHHGILGMHWGIRRFQPYPSGSKNKGKEVGAAKKVKQRDDINRKVINTKDGDKGYEYSIKDSKGKIISKLKSFDYSTKNFNWELISDVDTDPNHRGKGLASSLINKMYNDMKKRDPKRGVYLFVENKNNTAINLYKKLDFDIVKPYSMNGKTYLIMSKGSDDIEQLKKMRFS